MNFIKLINKYNKDNYIEKDIKSIDEIDLYQRMIDNNENITEDRYVEIINNIIGKMNTNVSVYHSLLVKISLACADKFAKTVLKKLIKEESDSLKIVRYCHILNDIDMNEYFNSQYENS